MSEERLNRFGGSSDAVEENFFFFAFKTVEDIIHSFARCRTADADPQPDEICAAQFGDDGLQTVVAAVGTSGTQPEPLKRPDLSAVTNWVMTAEYEGSSEKVRRYEYDNSGNHVGYPYHRLNDFPSAAAFDQFIADIKGAAFTGTDPYVGRCLFETGITPQFGDKLVCLSTCEYTLNDGRLVIMGVQVD